MGGAGHENTYGEGLAFFGEVIAAQSHELANVLNIINEMAGLQHDLLTAGKEGSPQRAVELAGRIQVQIERGRQILRRVNQFAHSVDVPWVVFEVNEVLARVAFFAERVARLNRTALATDFPTEPVAVESNPFCVQQAVFAVLVSAIAAATTQRRVRLGLVAGAEGAEISVRSADPIPAANASAEHRRLLEQLLGEIDGKILESPRQVDDDGWRLLVPSRSRGPVVQT